MSLGISNLPPPQSLMASDKFVKSVFLVPGALTLWPAAQGLKTNTMWKGMQQYPMKKTYKIIRECNNTL